MKHINNEIFFNITEQIDAIVDRSGAIITAELNGRLECDSRLSGEYIII